jgi:SulP family sulfate permease
MNRWQRLRAAALPFLEWRPLVTRTTLKRDAYAALTNTAVLIPQAVAFAAIAGLPPEYGFFAAFVPPIVAALFGSSWHLVSGPTAAISALVFSTLTAKFVPGTPEFVQAALTLAFMVGVFQLGMGLARLGQLANFASTPVLTGFATGAAVLIVLAQLEYVLDVELPRPQDFRDFVATAAAALPRADLASLGVAATTFLLALAARAWRPGMPHYLLALFGGSFAGFVAAQTGHPVPTVGSLQLVLPDVAVPDVSIDAVRALAQGALAVALVGLLEAVAIARAAAQRSGQTIDSNREFVGQGLANAVGSCFSSYPVSGSFTRTSVNLQAGGATPLSAILSSVFLLGAVAAFAPAFAHVPVAAVAAVVVLSAAGLLGLGEYRRLALGSPAEMGIATATLVATLVIGLEFAIYVGVLAALLLFVRRTTRPSVGITAPDPMTPHRMFRSASTYALAECPQLVFVRVNGPLYFGAVSHLRDQLHEIELGRPGQKHMLLMLRGDGDVDVATADLFEREGERRRARGGRLHLATRLHSEVDRLRQLGVIDALGADAVHENKGTAIQRIVDSLDPQVCAACTARIFRECSGRPGAEPAAATES